MPPPHWMIRDSGMHGGIPVRYNVSKFEAKQKSNGHSQSIIFCSSLLRDKVEGFASGVLEGCGYLSGAALVDNVEWGSAGFHR